MSTDIATIDEDLGPAMLACTPLQRRFVIALLENGDANATKAAEEAGYSASSRNMLRVQAHNLMHSEKVLNAIAEQGRKHLRTGAFIGIRAVMENAGNPTHKDKLKAAMSRLNRIGLHEMTEHKVTVERTDDRQLEAKIISLAKELGIDYTKLLGANSKVDAIDAEFVDVTPKPSAGPELEPWEIASQCVNKKP